MNSTFQSKTYTPSYIQHISSISKMQSGLKLLNWYIILIGQKYTVPRYKLIAVILSFSLRIKNVLYHCTYLIFSCKFSTISFKIAIKHLG